MFLQSIPLRSKSFGCLANVHSKTSSSEPLPLPAYVKRPTVTTMTPNVRPTALYQVPGAVSYDLREAFVAATSSAILNLRNNLFP